MAARSLVDQLAASPPGEGDAVERWQPHLHGLAKALLLGCSLSIGGEAHTLCEIEFYLHTEAHPDPFTHCSEAQRGSGRWYFHRAGPKLSDGYRGGSFKGLDLSFGPGGYGGILVRSLRRDADGAFINGSSLRVDHMLSTTGSADVAALDASVQGHALDDPSSPLALLPRPASSGSQAFVYETARVGLTLKRVAEFPSMPKWIGRNYRFLTATREIKKGRAQLIVSLHERGASEGDIRRLTGSPRKTIEQYLAAYAEGLAAGELAPYLGRKLDARTTCGLLGACAAQLKRRA